MRTTDFKCCPPLQVSSELEVFAALVAWVERDPDRRLRGFAQRLAAAVRLSLLTLQDFEYVDSHPLVSGHSAADLRGWSTVSGIP